MYLIEKRFEGYPFAHRQPKHKGHCAFVHGHNWDFTIKMMSEQLDENDFVYDFGNFKWLKEWFTEMFDHTCVINSDDPLLETTFKPLQEQNIIKLRIVPSGSAEGLAKLVYDYVDLKLKEAGVKATLTEVSVHEDYKNTASYFGSYQ